MVLMKKMIVYFVIWIFVFASAGCKENKERFNYDLTIEKLSIIPKEDGIIGFLYDNDGFAYTGIKLGNQIWLDKDLVSGLYSHSSIHYSDGTEITKWGKQGDEEKSCYFQCKEDVLGQWRAAYNGYAAMNKEHNICPKGWHVPSDEDWEELENYLKKSERYSCEGNSSAIAKSLAAHYGWAEYRHSTSKTTCHIGYNPKTTNNSTGFCALPYGIVRVIGDSMVEEDIRQIPTKETKNLIYNEYHKFISAGYWSSSGNAYYLFVNSPVLEKDTNIEKTVGLSVRCVRSVSN